METEYLENVTDFTKFSTSKYFKVLVHLLKYQVPEAKFSCIERVVPGTCTGTELVSLVLVVLMIARSKIWNGVLFI